MNEYALIFDLDNTLVECSEYYASAKRQFAVLVSDKTGISQDVALSILDAIDAESIKIDGFGKTRFPKSFKAASLAIDVLMGVPLNQTRASKAWTIGNSVFNAEYPLYPGAWEMLENAKNLGFNLFLCTKGDTTVQMKKVKKNNLHKIFPKGHIYIDVVKNETHFQKIINAHGLNPAKVVVIGDSIKDDIGSANKVGLTSVHISKQQVGGWGYENEENHPTFSLDYIRDLNEVLNRLASKIS